MRRTLAAAEARRPEAVLGEDEQDDEEQGHRDHRRRGWTAG